MLQLIEQVVACVLGVDDAGDVGRLLADPRVQGLQQLVLGAAKAVDLNR